MDIVIIAGHLGNDPEVGNTPDGTRRVSFSVATNKRRKGQTATIWWRVTVWGNTIDHLLPFLKKGTSVVVNGELSRPPEPYTGKDGQQRLSLDLTARSVQLSPFGRSERQGEGAGGQAQTVGVRAGGARTPGANSRTGGGRTGDSSHFALDDFEEEDEEFASTFSLSGSGTSTKEADEPMLF